MPPKGTRYRQFPKQNAQKEKKLELLPSISRSGGGDNAEGDSLKDHKVQEQYMEWIENMVAENEKKVGDPPTQKDKLIREDIIRCFRKLREGVIASNRKDEFARQVYETSLFLAAAYGITDQVTAISSKMLPHEIFEPTSFAVKTRHQPLEELPSEIALLLILLHHLILANRNSLSLRWAVTAISDPRISSKLATQRLQWLRKLRILLFSRNYHALAMMVADDQVKPLIADIISPGLAGERQSAGVHTLLVSLLHTTNDTTWSIIRSAYREESEAWVLSTLPIAGDREQWVLEKQKAQEILLVQDNGRRLKLYRPRPPN